MRRRCYRYPGGRRLFYGDAVKAAEIVLVVGLFLALGAEPIGVQAFGALMIFLANAVMPMEIN